MNSWLTTALLLLPPSAPTSDLDLRLVPADTPFLVHLDVRALLASELVTQGLAEAGIAAEDLSELGDLREMTQALGVNPIEDLYSVTVFSSGSATDQGAALLRTSAKLDAVLEMVRLSGELRVGRLEGHDVYGLEEALAYVHPGKDAGERLLVLTSDEAQLWGAIQVLEGRAPSLASARSSRLGAGDARPGTFLAVEVGDVLSELAREVGEPASRLARLVGGFSLAAGEHQGKFFVDVALETAGEDQARQVSDIVRGLTALVALVGEDDIPPLARELLGAVQASTDGSRVRFRFERASRSMIEDLRELHGAR